MNTRRLAYAAVISIAILAIGESVSVLRAKRGSESPVTWKPRATSMDRLPDAKVKTVMQYYLLENSEDPANWVDDGGKWVSKVQEPAVDADGKSIRLSHSVRIAAFGKNNSKQTHRRAFIIETAYSEPNAMFPENDRYNCEVLVLASTQDGWEIENLNTVREYRHEGGTRFAKDCEGFKVKWKNGFPVFSRMQTYGPYAGGEFVTAREIISRKNGSYQMD